MEFRYEKESINNIKRPVVTDSGQRISAQRDQSKLEREYDFCDYKR